MDSDDRLVETTLAGDLTAYGVIVDRYRDRVYNLAYRMLGDRERAEDATQEVFIRVYRGLRGYRASGRFVSWLLRAASNLCIDKLRQRPFAATSIDRPDRQPFADTDRSSDPEASLRRREVERRVHAALGKLPDRQRPAVTLVHLEGLSYEAAAEVLGRPVGTVKSDVHRARLRLKTLLAPDLQEALP